MGRELVYWNFYVRLDPERLYSPKLILEEGRSAGLVAHLAQRFDQDEATTARKALDAIKKYGTKKLPDTPDWQGRRWGETERFWLGARWIDTLGDTYVSMALRAHCRRVLEDVATYAERAVLENQKKVMERERDHQGELSSSKKVRSRRKSLWTFRSGATVVAAFLLVFAGYRLSNWVAFRSAVTDRGPNFAEELVHQDPPSSNAIQQAWLLYERRSLLEARVLLDGFHPEDLLNQARKQYILGSVERLAGNCKSSLIYMEQAEALYEKLDVVEGLLLARCGQAAALAMMGDLNRAELLTRDVFDALRQELSLDVNRHTIEAEAHRRMFWIACYQKQFGEAERRARLQIASFEKAGQLSGYQRLYAQQDLAYAFILQGKYSRARLAVDEIDIQAMALGSQIHFHQNLQHKALLALVEGDETRAQFLFDQLNHMKSDATLERATNLALRVLKEKEHIHAH